MRMRNRVLGIAILTFALGILVGPAASSGAGRADGAPNTGPTRAAGPGPNVFSATDWFVSNTLGVGTDTPDDDIELFKTGANFPFMHIDTGDGADNAGIHFSNPNSGVTDCIFTSGTAFPPANTLRINPGCAGTTGMTLARNGNVGVGTLSGGPLTQLHVGPGALAPLTAGASLMVEQGSASSMILKSTTGTESFFYQDGNNGLFGTATNTPMGVRTNNQNRLWITEGGLVGIGTNFPTSTLHVVGSLSVTGTKNFVQRNPENAKQNIVYAALEGPEAGTYMRGSGTLVNGVARIALPHHFSLVTEEKSLTVQLTPRGKWSQLYVEKLTPGTLVVRSASGQTGEFDYLVQGVRKGFANFKVIRGAKEVEK